MNERQRQADRDRDTPVKQLNCVRSSAVRGERDRDIDIDKQTEIYSEIIKRKKSERFD